MNAAISMNFDELRSTENVASNVERIKQLVDLASASKGTSHYVEHNFTMADLIELATFYKDDGKLEVNKTPIAIKGNYYLTLTIRHRIVLISEDLYY